MGTISFTENYLYISMFTYSPYTTIPPDIRYLIRIFLQIRHLEFVMVTSSWDKMLPIEVHFKGSIFKNIFSCRFRNSGVSKGLSYLL